MDNNILQYISPEILRNQNAEFLAAYPTDDAQIDYYTDLALKLWEEFQIDGSYDVVGTRINVKTWYENKREQMEMFRNHPYWCEEAKAIIFSYKEIRKVNFLRAYRELDSMRGYIYRHVHRMSRGDIVLYAIQEAIVEFANSSDDCIPTMTANLVNKIESKLDMYSAKLPKGAVRMLRVGTKISRFIRKCCEEYHINDEETINAMDLQTEHDPGDRNFDSTEKRFAKLSDTLSELATTKTGFMSLNFLDFMTMSNGNSWSTCHYINSHGLFHDNDSTSSYSGAYKQGCLSYALDKPSFIFYTLPDKLSETDYYRKQKLTRMCCQYANGALVTGKCYPNNDSDLIGQYVNMLQSIIAVTEANVDEWELTSDIGVIQDSVATAKAAAHYADYIMGNQRPTISLCRRLLKSSGKQMTIGHQAYCVYCGTELQRGDSRWLQCSPHRKKMVCAHCGKKLTEDVIYHEYGDSLFCGECAFYCAVHKRVEMISELYGTILMKDGEVQVCNTAMRSLAKCENCGIYGYKFHMLKTETGYSCKKHVRRYKKCVWCGVYVLNKEVNVHNDRVYCAGCNTHINEYSGIHIKEKYEYDVGDYVALEANLGRCVYWVNGHMQHNYPGKIVKIVGKYFDSSYDCYDYRFELGAGEGGQGWHWSQGVIKGAVIGADDSFIGKRWADIIDTQKGE